MTTLVFLLFSASLIGGGAAVAVRCSSDSVAFGPDVPTGVFKSPGFPLHYCNDLRSVFEIEPRGGHAVSLTVEFFDTEELHDFVEVHQTFFFNDTYSSAKQHVLSGVMGHQPRHFTSAKNGGLRVVFVTDVSNNEFSGFQMSFTRFSDENFRHVACPFPFHVAKREPQALPTVQRTFLHDTSCVVQINSTDAVKLIVKRLSTAVSLKLLETENFRSNRVVKILESLNAYHVLPYTTESRTNSLSILISFSSVLSDHEVAYDIDFETTKSVCTCNERNMTVTNVVPKQFLSPGYPLEYCDDLDCTTHVVAVPDHHGPVEPDGHQYDTVVQVQFHEFNVELDVDFLQLIDKVPLVNLSDNAKGLSTFTFDNRQVDLRFLSDHSVVEKGFNVSLVAHKKRFYCLCPDSPKKLATNASQSYEERHKFAEDCRFMDCFWRIYPPDKESIFRITMKVNFRLQSASEFFEVSNGENLERMAGKIRLEADAVPEENDLAERFVEFDEGIPYVQIWYHREGDSMPGERTLNFEYSWRKRCQCGPNVLQASTDDWVQLTSPDYPTPYCNLLSCTWFIEAPEDHQILVNITDFLTEIDQDFLGIFNGNDTNGTHIELLSGIEQFENLVVSDENRMSILFTSDVSLSLRGFSLWFKAQPTENYQRDSSATHGRIGLVLFFFFLVISLAAGTIVYLIRTDRLRPTWEWDARVIRFVNDPNRRRTESESSLMNPVFRTPTGNDRFR